MHIIQILDWLQKKKGKFTSHDTQNEILKLMALSVLREIAVSLQRTELYTIMADECTDIGNREQVTFTVLKSVCFSPDITATTIVSAIQDTLAR